MMVRRSGTGLLVETTGVNWITREDVETTIRDACKEHAMVA